MQNTGKVLAIDIHPHRVELMKKMLSSLKLTNATCVCFDSTKLSSKEKLVESFDKVLLDAPCLGLGVVRRKPDILLNLKDENLDEIESIQAKLLDQAYEMLKSKGEMVYSTCSINKKENDSQIMTFLSRHKDMKRVFEKQIFPNEYDSDGFYICKLVKE
jgi:16S rRNA (cytosine967-C5)-methyltransferase